MSKPLLTISKLGNVKESKIPGFCVASTAPINVEGDNLPTHKNQVQNSQETTTQQEEDNLNSIAELIYQKSSALSSNKTDFIELVISTHGFSNSLEASRQRFEEIYFFINNDNSQQFKNRENNLIYIGYRWPSEPLVGANSGWWKKILHTVEALPILPRIILMFGTLGILISIFFKPSSLLVLTPLSFIFSIIVLILITIFFFVVSLIILRLLIYFRDAYRAAHFGVPDLVELIRQLDKTLVSKAKQQFVPDIYLITNLQHLLLEKLKNQLALDGIIPSQPEESLLEAVCQKVAINYCKDKTIERIKIEDVLIQGLDNTNKFTRQGDIDVVAKMAYAILKQETDAEFVRNREEIIKALEDKAQKYWSHKNRIKLTFIGHSMGGEVVTSVIRIISDVFDLSSIETLGLTDKLPSSDIGRVFSLERLVLVSPDIPVSTILSGRANVLRSSLRRFKETYLFSNEGDLALRLASTVANYFSFPARTRESGYRLGNVAIRDKKAYGILNLNSLQQGEQSRLLKSLSIDSFNSHSSLAQMQDSYQLDETEDKEQIAKLFTYFDCTDYIDQTIEPNSKKRRVLSLKKWRWEPRWIYYVRLIIAYGLGIKDTHGGYFRGQFSQQLIYRLAFLGFGGFLDSLNPDERATALNYLSQECRQKKIQIILSPERYKVDILGRDREQIRREMLNS